MRLWKINEESQLIFRTGSDHPSQNTEKDRQLAMASGGSVDCVAMIDEETFVSGSDSGSVSLWKCTRKKPWYTRLNCHALPKKDSGKETSEAKDGDDQDVVMQESNELEKRESSDSFQVSIPTCTWVTALAAIPYSDIFASASGSGFINIYKLAPSKKSFSLHLRIPCPGIVNSLEFCRDDGKRVLGEDEEGGKEERWNLVVGVGREHKFGRWWCEKGVKNGIRVFSLSL